MVGASWERRFEYLFTVKQITDNFKRKTLNAEINLH